MNEIFQQGFHMNGISRVEITSKSTLSVSYSGKVQEKGALPARLSDRDRIIAGGNFY